VKNLASFLLGDPDFL